MFTRKAIGVIEDTERGTDAAGAPGCAGVCVMGALEVLGREWECVMDACEGRVIGFIWGDAARAARLSVSKEVSMFSCWAASGSISDAEMSGILEVPSAGEAWVSVVTSIVVGVLEPRPS